MCELDEKEKRGGITKCDTFQAVSWRSYPFCFYGNRCRHVIQRMPDIAKKVPQLINSNEEN